jgi:phage-related protein
MKGVEWRGDSKTVFMGFPEEVHDDLGHALRDIQKGLWPSAAKPLAEVGSGVIELRKRFKRSAYRVVYIAKLGLLVYILHCFVKDSKEGIKTRDREMQVVKKRLADLKKELGIK